MEHRIFGEPQEGVEYTERVGAYGIASRGEKVLIEKARLGYFLPGGGVDEGEAIEAALVLEVREESGYEIVSWELLCIGVEYLYIPEKNFAQKKVGHFFLVELGERGEPTYPDKHVMPVAWLSVDEALKGMYLESQRWAIETAMYLGV